MQETHGVEYASRQSDEPEVTNAMSQDRDGDFVYFGSSGAIFMVPVFGSIIIITLMLLS